MKLPVIEYFGPIETCVYNHYAKKPSARDVQLVLGSSTNCLYPARCFGSAQKITLFQQIK